MCRLALDENLSWVVFLLAGIAMVVLSVIRWPYGALAILIASSAMPRFLNISRATLMTLTELASDVL